MDTGTLEWDIALKFKTHAYRKGRKANELEPEIDAQAIAEHLRGSGWQFTRREPARPHSWPKDP
jgi:hypothetical protein